MPIVCPAGTERRKPGEHSLSLGAAGVTLDLLSGKRKKEECVKLKRVEVLLGTPLSAMLDTGGGEGGRANFLNDVTTQKKKEAPLVPPKVGSQDRKMIGDEKIRDYDGVGWD